MMGGVTPMKTAILARRLIDGRGGPPLDNPVVLVEGDRIAQVGSKEQVQVPPGAETIDLGDRTLLPGFVDAHTHLSIVPSRGDQLGQMKQPPLPQAFRAVANMRRMLRSGVTTARIMGEEHYLDLEARLAVESGQIPGPRLIVATRSIVATNAHGSALTLSDGADAVRRTARENLKAGADFLKTFATGGMSSKVGLDKVCYSDAEIAAIVEEADRGGTYVAAHAHGGEGLTRCLQLGVRTIEHAGLAEARHLELAVQKGAWLVGTFAILYHPMGIETGDFHVPEIREKVLRGREMVRERWATVISSGVNWALGTDSVHGFIAFEPRMAVELGAKPVEAIMGITLRAAEACRVEDRVGSVEPGKMADLVAVPGNPLESIESLERVEFLMKGGRRYDQLSLD
jgi:imidazolonepropionase-like amidohydrolase